MAVDFDAFVRWAEDRFNGNVIVKGNEVKVNSVFAEDHKHHMWCNPDGGKHHREDGCYRCFYTDKRGTLTGLVMLVDGCSYDEAKEILSGQTSIRVLEERLDAFFREQESLPYVPESAVPKLKLPEDCYLISEMNKTNLHRMEAESYLNSRLIPIDGMFYCTGGDFKNRIIIPYYDEFGKLIYFNGRSVSKKSKLRYMGPPKSVGIGKGDVLYTPKWAPEGEKIYLTEGELDALTLYLCGFWGMACGGKYLSEQQLSIIRKKKYKVCLALDTDPTVAESASPGFMALLEMSRKLMAAFVQVSFVRPPKAFKDWNKMLVDLKNPLIVQEYIRRCEKSLDPLALEQLMCLS